MPVQRNQINTIEDLRNYDGGMVTVAAAARVIGVSRRSISEGVSRGEIPSNRLGHLILIPREYILNFVAGGSPAVPTS